MINGGSKNKGSKTYNKNEIRRRGLCFIYKGPWAPNHSCLGDKETTRVEQLETPSDHEDSSFFKRVPVKDLSSQVQMVSNNTMLFRETCKTSL